MTFVKITTASFSAVSSVSIDNCFSASYTHYLVTRNLLGSAVNDLISIRLRVSGADANGANYRKQWLQADGTAVSGNRATGNTSFNDALGYADSTAIGFANCRISNPYETARTTMWNPNTYLPTGNLVSIICVQAHDLANSYTGLTAYPNTGTITGSITVYGLRAS
jgi:hypothetical protein